MKNPTLSKAAAIASELSDLLTQAEGKTDVREAIHLVIQCEARANSLKNLVGQFIETDHYIHN